MEEHIITLWSKNICCDNYNTDNDLYISEPLYIKGANPTEKKWPLGKGTKFTAIFLKSEFNCPGKRKQHVIPVITPEIKWFKSPYVGLDIFNMSEQILNKF